ncbi:hypothetical protein SAMN02745146_2393 [Hymenobacter daecheongensis DSM 21074]|uniref:Ethylene receptor 1-like N-terminal domain-containing protein n=1 Tax=Hymenobacter daecheongensis DSM 21074 TaxID=1121955 RepID=A0A1M6GU38_9BACT|nr:OmpH family outer membrane protein [Hymenobacter daecheongensis]SHJ13488.1 hypothetical protein SAMN02745146_2393 [Hymenobacter daecheongensis DSM 21074]
MLAIRRILSLLLFAAPVVAAAQPAAPALAPVASLSLAEQVSEFFTHLLDPTGFPARWHCGRWTDFHGWLYIGSDFAIWAAYFIIPLLLIYFIRQRGDVPFNRLFWLFGLFIAACGATHLLDAVIFWVPLYRLSGLVRLITAVASWGTVLALYRVLPQALLLRTPTQLEEVVRQRTQALAEVNEQLQSAYNDLEAKISFRTLDLEHEVQALRLENERLRQQAG